MSNHRIIHFSVDYSALLLFSHISLYLPVTYSVLYACMKSLVLTSVFGLKKKLLWKMLPINAYLKKTFVRSLQLVMIPFFFIKEIWFSGFPVYFYLYYHWNIFCANYFAKGRWLYFSLYYVHLSHHLIQKSNIWKVKARCFSTIRDFFYKTL